MRYLSFMPGIPFLFFLLLLACPDSLFSQLQNARIGLDCVGNMQTLSQNDLLTNPAVVLTMDNSGNAEIDDLTGVLTVSRNGSTIYQATTEGSLREGEVIRITNVDVFSVNERFTFVPTSSIPGKLMDAFETTGFVPPGEYRIKIVVSAPGVTSVEKECTLNIMGAVFDLELISPGLEFGAEPPEVPTRWPFFQWESSAERFNFFIYEVRPGQSLEETVHSQPVYYLEDYSEKLLPYPVGADLLEAGQTYAWQVQAITTGFEGEQITESKIYTFRIVEGTDPLQQLLFTLPQEISSAVQAQIGECDWESPALLNEKEISLERVRDIFRQIREGELQIRNIQFEESGF
jgi:hypothetical protein